MLVLLPGPPHEMQPMFEEQVLPVLRERARRTRAAHAHPQDRGHGRERRRAGGGPRLQDVHEPADHDPGRAGTGGAAPDRGRRVRAGGGGAHRGAGRRASASGWPGASTARTAGSCTRWWAALLQERGLTARHRGILHGRPARRAADGEAGIERVLRSGLGDLRQSRESRGPRHRPCAHRAPRCRLGRGRARDGRRGRARARASTSAWPSPASPGPGGGTPEKPVGPRLHRPQRRGRRPRAPRALPERPRPRALPVHAVGAGDDPAACSASPPLTAASADAGGTLVFLTACRNEERIIAEFLAEFTQAVTDAGIAATSVLYVVDDLSTDGSREVLSRHEERTDQPIRVRMIPAATNLGNQGAMCLGLNQLGSPWKTCSSRWTATVRMTFARSVPSSSSGGKTPESWCS